MASARLNNGGHSFPRSAILKVTNNYTASSSTLVEAYQNNNNEENDSSSEDENNNNNNKNIAKARKLSIITTTCEGGYEKSLQSTIDGKINNNHEYNMNNKYVILFSQIAKILEQSKTKGVKVILDETTYAVATGLV